MGARKQKSQVDNNAAPSDARARALRIAAAALEKHATDVVILELSALSALADYFVICSAASDPQLRAIVDAVDGALSPHGIMPLGVEGTEGGVWVLADYSDVVLHVFQSEARAFYSLDRLWADAPVVPVPPPARRISKRDPR